MSLIDFWCDFCTSVIFVLGFPSVPVRNIDKDASQRTE